MAKPIRLNLKRAVMVTDKGEPQTAVCECVCLIKGSLKWAVQAVTD